MGNSILSQTLWDKYLARALDYSDLPMTQNRLIQRCEFDIEMYGREAMTELYMRGTVGMEIKNRRRLFPTGPLGHVEYGASGRLCVKFPSLKLLEGLDGPMSIQKHSALAKHYLEKSNPAYPGELPLALALQLARQMSADVEIEEDVVESVWRQCRLPFNSYSFATSLLRIEDEAHKRRWRRVDLPRWAAAGLDWPALPIKRRVSRQGSNPQPRFYYILTSDEKDLLDTYRKSSSDVRMAIKATSGLLEKEKSQ